MHSAPFLPFPHILLYINFFLCILPQEILFLSLVMLLIGESSEFNIYFKFQLSKASVELYVTF